MAGRSSASRVVVLKEARAKSVKQQRSIQSVTSVRPNDFPVSESIGLMMRIALSGLRASFRAELTKHGVPWSTWHYFRVLYEHDGISQRELTERIGAMQPNTVSVLQIMVKAGWVTVARGEDRRCTVVSLTKKGRKLIARMLPDIPLLVRTALLDGFTEQEEAELRRLLNKICGNIRSAPSTKLNSGDTP